MLTHKLSLEDQPRLLDEHGPVFIMGCPRSGTTFLSKCIGAIPEVEEFVGVLAPPRLMHLIGSPVAEPNRSHLMHVVRDLFWQSFWRRIYFRDQRVAQFIRGNSSLASVVAPASRDHKIFCYKEPFLCFAAAHFSSEFPAAKFIHIVRDGRDNADSLERTYPNALTDEVLTSQDLSFGNNSEIGLWRTVDGFNFPWWVSESEQAEFKSMGRYGRCIRLWREMTQRAIAAGRPLGPNRYFEIRYEDFVRDPVVHGNRIREFIGAVDSARFQRRLKKAFQTSISIAGKNQSAERLAIANAIAGPLLAELGYLQQ